MEAKDIDVMFLQEIDVLDFSPPMINIPGFHTFVDGGQKKKRVCTIVRQNIFENITQVYCCDSLPQIWLQVTEHSGRKTMLVNIYREWCKNQLKVVRDLKENISTFSNSGARLMIAGDFNLNPNRTKDTTYPSRNLMTEFISGVAGLGVERYSFGDTFSRIIEGKIVSSELDWLLSNCNVSNMSCVWYGISDHCLLLWKLISKSQETKTSHIPLRNLNKVDHVSFARDLSLQPWELLGDTNLTTDVMARKFNSLFLKVLDKHAPLRYVRTKRKQTPKPSYSLQKLRRQRDNARSKGQLAKLRLLRSQCNKLSRVEAINYAKVRIQKNDNNVWKIVNETLGKSGQFNTNTITNDKGIALPMKEAANRFNKFFIEKIEKIQKSIPQSNADPMQGAKRRASDLCLQDKSFYLHTVSENEVLKAIKQSKGSSCPDYFGISPAALRLAPHAVAIPLTWIINKIIVTGMVPSCWKIARILPLHKKKSKDKVENYRPVSILPSPSKIMEMIVQAQFSAYFERKNILPLSQYGFRQGLSTIHAAGAADHDWKMSRQSGLACGALFFDLSAAFDTIDVGLLTSKLLAYGAGSNVISWTKSYLTGRRQCVVYGGETSPIVDVVTGSPQGSVISPLLFLILVADIEAWITKAKAISYADDTTVYCVAETRSEVRSGLETAAKEVLLFMQASMLSANPSKTKFLMFGRAKEDPLRVGEVMIQESKEEVLLGITFNKSLTWSSHVNSLKMELKKRIGILRRMSFELPTDVVKEMIQPIFTSKLLYGLSLLASKQGQITENTLLKQLCSLHHQAMKAALRIHKRHGISYPDLLQLTGQKPIFQLALEQLSNNACKCLSMEEHPLVINRIEKHKSKKITRQARRDWPPQSTQHSVITKMVEVWEQIPGEIRSEQDCFKRKKEIQKWSVSNTSDA